MAFWSSSRWGVGMPLPRGARALAELSRPLAVALPEGYVGWPLWYGLPLPRWQRTLAVDLGQSESPER